MTVTIGRRELLAALGGAAAAWPLAARAQQRAGRVRRIAWLGIGRADEPSPYVDSLRAGLRELGWIEGSNLTIVSSGQRDEKTWKRRRANSSRPIPMSS
jgi:putative ABC transport system substrate-binding protein